MCADSLALVRTLYPPSPQDPRLSLCLKASSTSVCGRLQQPRTTETGTEKDCVLISKAPPSPSHSEREGDMAS